MRFLEDIKIPVCLSMGICAVRAFIHSLITEEERYSRLYNSIYKERLEYINTIENWLLIVSISILIPSLVYNIKKKRVKNYCLLLMLIALVIPWISFVYCFKWDSISMLLLLGKNIEITFLHKGIVLFIINISNWLPVQVIIAKFVVRFQP